jgi:hypothetical protein
MMNRARGCAWHTSVISSHSERQRKEDELQASVGKVSKTLSQKQNTKQKGWGCSSSGYLPSMWRTWVQSSVVHTHTHTHTHAHAHTPHTYHTHMHAHTTHTHTTHTPHTYTTHTYHTHHAHIYHTQAHTHRTCTHTTHTHTHHTYPPTCTHTAHTHHTHIHIAQMHIHHTHATNTHMHTHTQDVCAGLRFDALPL